MTTTHRDNTATDDNTTFTLFDSAPPTDDGTMAPIAVAVEERPFGLERNGGPANADRTPWHRPFTMAFGLLVALGTVLAALALSPLVLAGGLLRWWRFRNPRYHRHPSSVRIAVVGGGWSGLQIAARLRELGVNRVRCFDRNDARFFSKHTTQRTHTALYSTVSCDRYVFWSLLGGAFLLIFASAPNNNEQDFGGTWHPSSRFHNLSIHSAIWSASFHRFPYSAQQRDLDRRIPGADLQAYMCRFADAFGLRRLFAFSSRVAKVSYHPGPPRTATLTVVDEASGEVREEGPFDFVIYASLASEPHMPALPGADAFAGRQFHSSQVGTRAFRELAEARGRVAVVGGSKSACDTVLNFLTIDPTFARDRLTWVFRRPYMFFRYETFFHTRTAWSTLRGAAAVVTWALSAFLPTLGWAAVWGLGYAWTYAPRRCWAPGDWRTFRFGMLDRRQRHALRKRIPHKVRGEPARLVADGLELADGTRVRADAVVWATGYRTGIVRVAYEKKGAHFAMPVDEPLYQHFVVPAFPVLGVSAQLFTTAGPLRAVNSADLAVYHLCVARPRSERDMRRAAGRLLCRQNMDHFILFAPKFWPRLILLQLDLVLAGIAPWWSVLWHYLGIAAFGRQSAMALHLLPPPKASAQVRARARAVSDEGAPVGDDDDAGGGGVHAVGVEAADGGHSSSDDSATAAYAVPPPALGGAPPPSEEG